MNLTVSRTLSRIATLLIVLACGHLFAQDGLPGALAESSGVVSFLPQLWASPVALADFDGDHRLDGAVLAPASGNNGYRINFHLSAGENSDVTFSSSEPALRIRALDIDGDGYVDIIVERPLSRERLFVWLNDGAGHFVPRNAKDYAPPPAPTSNILSDEIDPQGAVGCPPTYRSVDYSVRARDSLPAPREPSLIIGRHDGAVLPYHPAFALPARSPPQTIQL